jgi:hypothetical protein
MKSKSARITPSAKPCDVEYRLNRLNAVLAEASKFLASIDKSVYPDWDDAARLLNAATDCVATWKAPSKKAYRKSDLEKAASAAAREAAREEARVKRDAERVERLNAKASKLAMKAEPKPTIDMAAGSAIEKAIAAAKARKAARITDLEEAAQ